MIIKTALNFATGGLYGVFKWLTRKEDGKPTFLGRVMALVTSHAIFSVLIGTVSLWGILKGFGKSILYLCLGVLHLAGGTGELPPEEGAHAKNFVAKVRDSVDEKLEKMKEAMEEKRRKMEGELAAKTKALEERDVAERIAGIKRHAEEEAARLRRDAQEQAAKVKAEMEARERELLAKAKANLPSPSGLALKALGDGISGLFASEDYYILQCTGCLTERKFRKADGDKTGICSACNTTFARCGIAKAATSSPLANVNSYRVACDCGADSVLFGGGDSQIFICSSCKKRSYILDGRAKLESYENGVPRPTATSPAPSPAMAPSVAPN